MASSHAGLTVESNHMATKPVSESEVDLFRFSKNSQPRGVITFQESISPVPNNPVVSRKYVLKIKINSESFCAQAVASHGRISRHILAKFSSAGNSLPFISCIFAETVGNAQ